MASSSPASNTMLGNSQSSVSERSYEEQAKRAGAALIELVSRDSLYGQGGLTWIEQQSIHECFELGRDSSLFADHYKDAVQAAVASSKIDALRFLHENYPFSDLLAEEPNVLPLALRAQAERHRAGQLDEAALDAFKALLAYGAPLNGLDERGNTPLYYATLYGWPNVFEILVDAGGDLSQDRDLCLLQVAANALQDVYDPQNIEGLRRPRYAYGKWQPIVNALVNAGFSLSLEHYATAAIIELACAEGTKEEAVEILSKSIVPDTGWKVVGNWRSTLTPALHAAVSEGRREIVELLLERGADPNDTLLYGNYMGRPSEDRTAVAQACLGSYKSPDYLDACEPLLNAGIGVEDQRLMLKASIKRGRIDLVERLIENGVTSGNLPSTSSLPVLQYLHEKNFAIDPVKAQENAVRIGSTEMLAWLVDTYGPQLKDVRALYHAPAENDRYGDPSNITTYLVREYGHDFDETEDLHARISREVLEYAASPERHDLLKSLLHLGTESQCPGVQQGAYNILRSMLRDGYQFRGAVSRGDVLVLQTLLQFGSNVDVDSHDSDQLWLSPSMLPSDLLDGLRAEKASFVNFGWTQRESSRDASMPLPEDAILKCIVAEEHDAEMPSVSLASDRTLKEPSEKRQIGDQEIEKRCSYTKLQGSDSFRLFHLGPAEGEDQPISGGLVDVRLTDKIQYDLLSSVAADGNDLVNITVNDNAHPITRDLHTSLLRLRKPNETRTLWIDELCVNHEDTEEKQQQAKINKQLIESADSSIIWLGEEADNSQLVFEHVKEWTTYRDDYLAGRRTDNDAFGEAHINPPHYSGEASEALQHLAMRPWFFNARVIGELAFSQKAYLMSGEDIEDFEMIVLPMSFHIGNGYDPVNAIHGPTRLHLLDDMTRQKRGCHARTLFDYFSLCDAQDQRDKVFAMLEFFAKPPMEVDYTLTVEETYAKFTQAVLEDRNDINMLHWLGSHRSMESLPSWVPDYSITQAGSRLPRVTRFSHVVSETGELLRHALPGLHFEDGKMVIRGVHLDKVKAVSEEMSACPAHAPGTAGFLDTLSKWEALAAKLENKRFPEPISSAFLNILIAIDTQPNGPGDKSLSPVHALWYDIFGSGLLRDVDHQAFQEAEILLQWRGGNYQSQWQHVDIDHFTRNVEQTIYGRSFFLTDSGSMGLGPREARVGDSIVYFPGGLYPFVLRPRGNETFEMIGDCYLYGFDEFEFEVSEVEGFGKFVVV
ncbi:hypothetical protein PRZ48_013178 [Zasmidium cellare]|uniref:Heterokaryon incompatibility domain-containing protein n=1 Tax=Zasmidium cellare TaxID=395010 RepID=A0ABR0E3R9_ZASCE|nr:hypothetical protein PRZ48_013178 [Zasmidium cellare]